MNSTDYQLTLIPGQWQNVTAELLSTEKDLRAGWQVLALPPAAPQPVANNHDASQQEDLI